MPLERRPDLVLFDLDGTLADTFPDLHRALVRALEDHGLPSGSEALVREQVSAGARAMTRAVLGEDHPHEESVCRRFLELYRDNVAAHTRLFDGMQAVLDRLGNAGCTTGIVTNKLAVYAEPLLARLALSPAPGCLVSGDTAARAKPHPDPLQHAAQLLRVSPARCAYVGDARNDVLAARAAGMPVAAARWGYIPSGDDPLRWQADAVLNTPHELPDWLGLPP